MTRKAVLIVLVLALLLAACGKKKESPISPPIPETPGGGSGQTTLSFAISDSERARYEGLVETFEAANPDLHIRLVSIQGLSGLSPSPLGGDWPMEAWEALVSGADVIDRIADRGAVEGGLLRDLSPLMQADPSFEPGDFYPSALESATWDGGVWTLPTVVSFRMIAYDKTAFDEAGLAYPEPGWTWDDLETCAQALTVREGDEVLRWGFVPFVPDHLPFVEGRAGPLIDATTDPPTPRLNQPEVIQALRWYADLYLKEPAVAYLGPEDVGRHRAEVTALIENGQAAMWNPFSPYWPWGNEGGRQGIAPYPVDGPDSRTTPIYVQGLTMSAGTAHPDAAWRWMAYVSRQVIETPELPGAYLAARRSVAGASGFWDRVDEASAAALRYALDHSYVQRRTEGYEIASEALAAILAGEKPVEEAAAEAQARIEATIRGVAMQQVAPPVVATPEDEESSEDGTVTIVFSPGLCGSACLKAYRDVAGQFREAHPDIHVEVRTPNLTRIEAVAKETDCFQWFPHIYNLEQQAAVLSLDPFLEADAGYSTDDFYPSLLESFTYRGQLWGLPSQFSPVVIEYNQDLFDAAGVSYPPLQWTTDDFLELAVALTQGEGAQKQYGFVPDLLEYNVLVEMMARLGARLVDENADPPALSFTDPTTVEALRWYANLSTEYGVKPVFLTDFSDWEESASFSPEWDRLVNGGRAAMWIDFTGAGTTPDELNTGIATLPTGTKNAGNAGTIEGYLISSPAARGEASTPDTRQACWQWITFLTGRPDLAQGLPARRSVAESTAYRQRVGYRQAAVYQASLADEDGTPDVDLLRSGSWLSQGLVWLGRAHKQVVNGEATAEEALAAAQKLADDYRACVVVGEAFDDQRAQWACVREVDPTLPAFLYGGTGEK